jgi:hypothetical protein
MDSMIGLEAVEIRPAAGRRSWFGKPTYRK